MAGGVHLKVKMKLNVLKLGYQVRLDVENVGLVPEMATRRIMENMHPKILARFWSYYYYFYVSE